MIQRYPLSADSSLLSDPASYEWAWTLGNMMSSLAELERFFFNYLTDEDCVLFCMFVIQI